MRQRRGWEEKLDIADGNPTGPAEPVGTAVVENETPQETQSGVIDDYKFVKTQLKKAIKTNQEVVKILLEELRLEPSARMAEVVARLLETLSNSGMQILNASKTVAEIHRLIKEETPKDATPNTIIKNAIFVGKLEDIFKLQDIQKQNALAEKTIEDEDPYA